MQRTHYLDETISKFKIHPIVAILGPRQCGKTTLASMFAKTSSQPVHYFDLENPIDLVRMENPKLTLEPLA